MSTRTFCLSDTIRQLHILAHNGYDSMAKIDQILMWIKNMSMNSTPSPNGFASSSRLLPALIHECGGSRSGEQD